MSLRTGGCLNNIEHAREQKMSQTSVGPWTSIRGGPILEVRRAECGKRKHAEALSENGKTIHEELGRESGKRKDPKEGGRKARGAADEDGIFGVQARIGGNGYRSIAVREVERSTKGGDNPAPEGLSGGKNAGSGVREVTEKEILNNGEVGKEGGNKADTW